MHTNSLPPTDRDETAEPSVPFGVSDQIESNPVQAMKAARQIVPGDVVNKATADLPDNQRSALRRFHAYYVENALSLEEAADLLHLSGTTISLVFNGRYTAKLDNIVAEIETFFRFLDKRSLGRKLTFIQTSMTKRIWQVCDAALEFQRIAFVFGDQQIGKTEALKAYQAEHNHGSTIYSEMVTGGSMYDYLVSLARELRISPNQRIPVLRQRIMDAFDDRMLLIVDEVHRCVDDAAYGKAIRTVEFLRELFNRRHCGMVCAATNVFRDEMESGPLEKILRQMKRRRLCSLQLPSVPTQADLNMFASAYKLAPATGDAKKLEADMVENEALGMWLTLLRMASKIAAQRKQPLEWAHVITAREGLKQLEGN